MTIPAQQSSFRNGSPVRVLIVAPSIEILGGQAVQAARLVDSLRSEPPLKVGFLAVNPRLPGLLRKLQTVKYLRTAVTSLIYIATLIARVPRYDVIHVFSASYLSFLLAPTPAILIARLLGKRVLLNYRSGQCEDHLGHWRTALPIIKLAHRVIVPSGYLVDVFARFGIRASPISNVVDLSRFAFRERKPLQPVLLSNRNFEKLYNVDAILRAFAVIQREVPHARLIVAGDGTLSTNLHSLTAELDLKNVEFTGAVAPEEMPELHTRADIFVNASDIDNMPVSIIEAFSSGLAVVTTDAGGIPHIVADGQNGLMVSCGDWKGIAQQVLALLENQELADDLVSLAREDSKKYSWDAMRLEWLEAYTRLAGRPDVTGAEFEPQPVRLSNPRFSRNGER